MLKDFATAPRIAAIVGENNKTYLKEFKGDDLSNVNRVIVDIGNPLARTTAGKVQMAEQMLQMGLIDTPQQYLTVIETGRLEGMVDDKVRQQFLMTEENEKLVNGEPVIAMITDQHMLHIKEHSSILSDPELRFDANLVERVTMHIQEHINVLRTSDPDLLMNITVPKTNASDSTINPFTFPPSCPARIAEAASSR